VALLVGPGDAGDGRSEPCGGLGEASDGARRTRAWGAAVTGCEEATVKFAFVIHPTSLEDVVRYEPGALGKGRPLIAKIMEWMPAYVAAHITGVRTPDGRETEGWFVAAPFMPEQMLGLPRETVYAKILAAIELGAGLGAEIVGLGAFTGVVGDAGITLAARSPIPVTTGNSLTIAAGVASLLRGARELAIDVAQETAVVLGATGSIGSACVELLAPHVARLVLVARNGTRLERFAAELRERVSCAVVATTNVREAVPLGRLVLTATSSTQELIEPADLQTGAVVCEISLPHDVGRRVALERPDVLVTEGGNMRVPGTPRFARVREPELDFDFGLPPGAALACMSETMVLALEERRESYTLGRGIDLAKVREIDALAARAGFELAGMRAFDRPVTAESISAVRAAARERAAALA
jgi:predicted amino acid dehydrogenase